MNDRELLELAAKAAGYNLTYYEFAGRVGMTDDDPDDLFWNPLTNDGDALRLAVKLQISPIYGTPCKAVCAFSMGESNESDPYTATRRAIVRAAAEIGKSK